VLSDLFGEPGVNGRAKRGFRRRALSLRRHLAAASVGFLLASLLVAGLNTQVNAADACDTSNSSLTATAYLLPGGVLCSNEGGNKAYNLQFQGDCNLVLLTARWKPLWSSNTGGATAQARTHALRCRMTETWSSITRTAVAISPRGGFRAPAASPRQTIVWSCRSTATSLSTRHQTRHAASEGPP
jgi:hypothetical protein